MGRWPTSDTDDKIGLARAEAGGKGRTEMLGPTRQSSTFRIRWLVDMPRLIGYWNSEK